MAKVVINNRAEPKWRSVIEAKLQLMLGSMLESGSRINAELDRVEHPRSTRSTYTFKLVLTAANGERHEQYNDQPDANLAIEGAMARLRRSIARTMRPGGPGWRRASGE